MKMQSPCRHNLINWSVRWTSTLFIFTAIAIATRVEAAGGVAGGVLNGTGDPIENIIVWAVPESGISNATSTRTDAQGNYAIPNLPAGVYDIRVKGFRYILYEQPEVAVVDDVTIEVNFQLLEGEIRGRVTDGDGNPIGRVDVSASAVLTVRRTRTDENGYYALGWFRPDTYTVYASSPNHPLQSIGPIEITEATPVVTGVDFVLGSGGRIEGSVRRPDTTPLEGAHVMAYSKETLVSDRTTDDGSFALRAVKAGTYGISVNAEGYAFARIRDVTVEDFAVTQVDVQMEPSAAIEGTVTSASSHAAIQGAAVTIDGTELSWFFARPLPETVTSSTGFYRLSGMLPSGTYELSVEPPNINFLAAGAEGICATAGQTTGGVDFELQSAARIKGDPAVVQGGTTTEATPLLLGPPGTISGTVLDASSGLPIPEMMVSGYLESDEEKRRSLRISMTDDSGHFALAGLATGDYVLEVSSSGLPPTYDGVELIQSATDGVDVAGMVLYATPLQLYSASGTALSASGEPLTDAIVWAVGEERPGWGLAYGFNSVNPDGSFNLYNLRPDTYRVVVDASQYVYAESDPFVISQSTGDVTGVQIVASSVGGTLEVHVRDAQSGSPIAGALVHCGTEGEAFSWSIMGIAEAGYGLTDASGDISLTLISEGRWCVLAASAGYVPVKCRAVDIVEGSTTSITIDLVAED